MMKRILALSLCLLSLLSLIGCSGVKPVDDRTVCKLNGDKITYDEFRYYFLNVKKDIDGGDESAWKGENAEELKKQHAERLEYALKRAAAIHYLADEYKLKLTSEDKDNIQLYIDQLRASVASEEEYQKQLASKFMTEYALEQVLTTQYLYEMVMEYVMDESNFIVRADDKTLKEELKTNFYCGTQILIRNDEGDDKEENKALADEVFAKLQSGEASFSELRIEYGEDPGLVGNDDGYYFTSGELLAYFEDAVKELEIGEYSGVIENVHGYAIVKRLPMDEAYIKEHFEDLRTSLMSRLFLELLEDTIEKMTIEATSIYYTFTVENVT